LGCGLSNLAQPKNLSNTPSEGKAKMNFDQDIEYLTMLYNLTPEAKAEWLRGEMIIENGEPTYELCFFEDKES
jgi:hypothetical protein